MPIESIVKIPTILTATEYALTLFAFFPARHAIESPFPEVIEGDAERSRCIDAANPMLARTG